MGDVRISFPMFQVLHTMISVTESFIQEMKNYILNIINI